MEQIAGPPSQVSADGAAYFWSESCWSYGFGARKVANTAHKYKINNTITLAAASRLARNRRAINRHCDTSPIDDGSAIPA
ncbi:hypothetical protein GCM10027613_29400 [Microlunatus endophyticus]